MKNTLQPMLIIAIVVMYLSTVLLFIAGSAKAEIITRYVAAKGMHQIANIQSR
jgi:hypothetical protein